MKKAIILILGIIFLNLSSNAQFIPCDKAYEVKYNPLLKKINEFKDFRGLVKLSNTTKVLPTDNCSLSYNAQEIIKNGNKLYVLLSQTGFIYEMGHQRIVQ